MTTQSVKEQINELSGSVEVRNKKIEDIRERIVRQEDHIRKTKRKKERFETHLNRWLYQNDRDSKKIEELKKQLEVPEDSPKG